MAEIRRFDRHRVTSEREFWYLTSGIAHLLMHIAVQTSHARSNWQRARSIKDFSLRRAGQPKWPCIRKIRAIGSGTRDVRMQFESCKSASFRTAYCEQYLSSIPFVVSTRDNPHALPTIDAGPLEQLDVILKEKSPFRGGLRISEDFRRDDRRYDSHRRIGLIFSLVRYRDSAFCVSRLNGISPRCDHETVKPWNKDSDKRHLYCLWRAISHRGLGAHRICI
jgi:hypothetical protein